MRRGVSGGIGGRRAQRGLSLIEVTLASALVAVVAIKVLGTLDAASENSARDTAAAELCERLDADITEITDNEVIHGGVTIAQTQATARLTQPCKLISNNATKNPDPRRACPSIALLPIHYSQYKVFND